MDRKGVMIALFYESTVTVGIQLAAYSHSFSFPTFVYVFEEKSFVSMVIDNTTRTPKEKSQVF